ncbi:MAG: S9 family peptidase [Chloroflexi bacterium]|nr:S9 family peptidase [Chloroflexota bacterium]
MPDRIEPDYFYDVITVAQPAMSPDGEKVAFVKQSANREANKIQSHIVMSMGEELRDYTSGPYDSSPRWSRSGNRLAFLRKDDSDKNQIWVMPTSMGEASPLTTQPGGVSGFEWSPDDSTILFQSTVDPRDEDPDSHKKPVVVNQLRYKSDGSGLNGAGRSHLFTILSDGGDATQLTHGDIDHYAPTWSPDGVRIAFIAAKNVNREFESRTEAYTMKIDTGLARSVTDGLYAVGGVTWSPDGSKLAVFATASLDDGGSCSPMCQSWIYIIENNVPVRSITDDSIYPHLDGYYDYAAGAMLWTEDDRIIFSAADAGQSYICSADVNSVDVHRLTEGGVSITGWSATADAGRVAVAAGSPDRISDLVVHEISASTRETITDFNSEWLAAHETAHIEKLMYQRDGVDLEARIYFPPGFDETAKYPLFLDVHGGPHGVFADTFLPIHQIGANRGYVVLAINPRGSSSYGRDFACAAHKDWGDGPYEDLMAGVELIATRPYINENAVVMHGSSYGGYMGTWMAGHTDRFRAIAVAAPVTNMISFWGTSDIGVHFSEIELGNGAGLESFEEYVKHSPIFYVPNVNTPILILHGEDDDRVPIEQGEQYFTALRRLAKEVEFVRLPDTSHGLFANKNLAMREEYFTRVFGWLESQLTPE